MRNSKVKMNTKMHVYRNRTNYNRRTGDNQRQNNVWHSKTTLDEVSKRGKERLSLLSYRTRVNINKATSTSLKIKDW